MEAYGKADNLRGRYIPGAVGCKRAGIKALRTFLDSGAATALICQDDCLWKPDAATTVARALRELPEDWDLLYFSASSREKNTPHSPHLVRLGEPASAMRSCGPAPPLSACCRTWSAAIVNGICSCSGPMRACGRSAWCRCPPIKASLTPTSSAAWSSHRTADR